MNARIEKLRKLYDDCSLAGHSSKVLNMLDEIIKELANNDLVTDMLLARIVALEPQAPASATCSHDRLKRAFYAAGHYYCEKCSALIRIHEPASPA